MMMEKATTPALAIGAMADQPSEEADDQLVCRILDGDNAAFVALVERYKRPVYALAYRLLGNATDAEDAAQETFVRAYTRLTSYQLGSRFGSWLLSITSHWCIDFLRRRARSRSTQQGSARGSCSYRAARRITRKCWR
jgi:DNA-directed RNA polymerase specialized sigma24 family protein